MQRDSIGLNGGMNVFLYCVNQPTILVDPTGLVTDDYLNRHAFKEIGLPGAPAGGVVGWLLCLRVAKPGQGIGPEVRGMNWFTNRVLRPLWRKPYTLFRWAAKEVLRPIPLLCISWDTLWISGDTRRLRPEDLLDPNGL